MMPGILAHNQDVHGTWKIGKMAKANSPQGKTQGICIKTCPNYGGNRRKNVLMWGRMSSTSCLLYIEFGRFQPHIVVIS